MALSDLNLQIVYRSEHDKLYRDFYQPCLYESKFYDRAAGYFSSNVLKRIAKGLEVFLFIGGKIRIVANAHLSPDDIEAIEKGHKAKSEIIEKMLLKEIEICEQSLLDDTLNVLAWLIYKGQLEIKIAHTNNHSLYHEKFGIFIDELGHKVGFTGSANETFSGVDSNFEKIDVFYSQADQPRVERMVEDFEKLWSNQTDGLTVIDVPASIKKKLLDNKREMPLVKSKTIEPRKYQKSAINGLKMNNWHGILEMATGTGKTITSLMAAKQYRKENKRMFLVIYAPFSHLVDQWENECEKLGFENVTLCYNSTKSWYSGLETIIRNYNIGIIDAHVVITTYKTASLQPFNDLIVKVADHAFLVADECHYLGSSAFKKLNFYHYDAKVGLSATPQRWWDEDGTNFIYRIFEKVVYDYSLEEAIRAGKLTPYEYFPQIVQLTEFELSQYQKLTKRIIGLYNQKEPDTDRIQKLNRDRSLILAKAYGKIPLLIQLLKEKGISNISHTLVYVGQGQVDMFTKLLSDLGLRVHRFNSDVPNKERKEILKAFDSGDIQVLVAIKCLDEGVDVPSTKTAFFLASTSNPREFVQRRGRILRTYDGKISAEIYDFIAFPQDVDGETFTMIAKKELPRFAEFSRAAINTSSAKIKMNEYLDYYNLSYLMDKTPWEVYEEMKEAYDTNDFTE